MFREGKGSSQKHLDLYAGHISNQLKERCFRPSLTHNTVGFNPIRVRVGIKSSHRCLLIHYYLINNNYFSPNCDSDFPNMPAFM